MKNRVSSIAAIASAVLLSAGYVHGEAYPMTFEQLDADSNGYISAEEAGARPGLSENLQASDQNQDGQLDISEFSALEGEGRFTPPEESEIPEPGAAPY